MKNNALFISIWGLATLALATHTASAEEVICNADACPLQSFRSYYPGTDEPARLRNKVVAPTLTVDPSVGLDTLHHADSNSYPTDNTVTVSDVDTVNWVYGALRIDNTAVSGNRVTINNVRRIDEYVYGGKSKSGDATTNHVTVSNTDISDDVYGGRSASGDANNNHVTVSSANIRDRVYGGRSSSGNANNNHVTVSSAHIRDDVLGGRSFSGNANNNHVTVSSARIRDRVYGGRSSSGNANDNRVIVSHAHIQDYVYGGISTSGNADGNRVTLNNVAVIDGVFGGISYRGNATGNHLILSGGWFARAVIGGSAKGDATNNSITLQTGNHGKPTFTFPASLYGGHDRDTATVNEVKTGNTLNMETAEIDVKNIYNFEYLHFYVQGDTVADTTFLTLTDTRATGTDISQTYIGVCVPTGIDSPLNVGDKLTLITGKNLTTDTTLSNNVSNMTDCTADYTFALDKVGNAVVATVTGAINPIIFQDSFETL